jgi:hypothetical protein
LKRFDPADAVETWMPGTKPGMTERVAQFDQITRQPPINAGSAP